VSGPDGYLTPQEWNEALTKLFSKSSFLTEDKRNLQETPACNEILDEYNREEAIEFVGEILDNLPQVGGFFKFVILNLIQYGVQVRKICAACTDFDPIDGFCSQSDYGSDVTHSGLAFIPLEESGTSILKGTHVPSIYCHGTRTSTQHSTDWAGSGTSTEVLLSLLITVTQGTVGILPDYMGYGESLGKAFRASLQRFPCC
jgi:hypothetical protein